MKRLKVLTLLTVAGLFLALGITSCNEEPVSGKYNLEISAISPDSGSISTKVTITGSGFAPNPEDNKITFHGTPAQVLNVQRGVITTKVPAGATTGPIKLTVGKNTIVGPAFVVLNNGSGGESLSIDHIDPTSGPVGTKVTIYGSGFSSDKSTNNVSFHGTPASVIKVVQGSGSTTTKVAGTAASSGQKSSKGDVSKDGKKGPQQTAGKSGSGTMDQLIVNVPIGATTGPVQVTVGKITATGPVFTVTGGSGPAPVINKIDPTAGKTCSTVTITGKNFSKNAMVNIGSKTATITSASSTELQVTVPSGLAKGTYKVTVTVNGQTTTAAKKFKVTGNGCHQSSTAPTIGKLTPDHGPVGTTVTITGNHFSKDAKVMFDSKKANVTYVSDKKLKVTVPRGSQDGNYDVTVMVNNQTSNKETFTVTSTAPKPPAISKITPNSGHAGLKGVKIEGSNFSSTASKNTVRFGSTQATVTGASNDGTQLTVTVPKGLSQGQYDVTVKANGSKSNAVTFTVTASNANNPTINNIDPTKGPVGTEIAINGSNFTNNSTVNFGSTTITGSDVTYVSDSKLKVDVPIQAKYGTSYDVTVTNKGQESNSKSFTVTKAFVDPNATVKSNCVTNSLLGCTFKPKANVIDGDITTSAHFGGLLHLLSPLEVKVIYTGGTAIPKGGKAGFVIRFGGGLIDAGVLGDITITTYDKKGNVVEQKSGDGSLLLVNLGGAGKKQFVGFVTKKPFSSIMLSLGANLANVAIDADIYGVFGDYHK